MSRPWSGNPPTHRRGKRGVVALVVGVLLFALAGFAQSSYADTGSATAVFGTTLSTVGTTIDPSPGSDDPAVNVKTYGGRDCWEIGRGRPSQFIYVTLDPAYKHEGANYASVNIDYFDSPGAKFTLVYDSTTVIWKSSTIVETTGSNTWKTARFFIPDGGFTKREDGRDMRIATWADGMGTSASPICFAQFGLTPSPIPTDDVQVKVTTLGNVFAPGTAATFGVLSARDESVPWTVRDYDGRIVRTGTAAIDSTSREGQINAGTLSNGYYTVTLNGTAYSSEPISRTAGFAVMERAPDPADTQDSMFGINHHPSPVPGFSWADTTALAARAGMENVRVDAVYWSNVERPKGTYQFSSTSENVANDLGSRGQQGLYILGYGHASYGGVPSTPEANEAFGNYAAAVATQFRGRIEALEVWNEYYGGFTSGVCSQSAKCYANMLAATYPKVKAAAPEMTLVGASSFKVPLDWFEELFQLGGLNYLDAISVHPYRAPGVPEGLGLDIDGLKKLIRKYNNGQDIPIWITEQGWSSATATGIGVSEKVQAQSVARSLLEAKVAGVEKYYWYDLVNDGTNPNSTEHNFGLLRRTSADATSLNPKPAYLAYSTVARELTSSDFVRSLNVGEDVRAYVFEGQKTALWSTDRVDKPVRVKADGPVTVVDMLGRERVLSPSNGWVYLTLTGEPLYVHADVSVVEETPLVRMSAPDTVAAGDNVPVTVTVDNRRATQVGTRSAVFTVEGQSVSVSAAPGRIATAVVTIPAGTVAGTRNVTGRVRINGADAGLAVTATEVSAEPVTVSVAPDIDDNGTNRLRVTVSNYSSSRPVRVESVDWSFGEVTGTIPARTLVGALESKSFLAEVKGQDPFVVKPVTARARVGDGRIVSTSDAFGFSPIVAATPRLRDGKLEGLDRVPVIDLAAVGSYQKITAAEADGDMWVSWDKTNLYVSAVVTEATYRKAKNALWLPAGDSIGIGLQASKPGEGLGKWGAEWFMLYAGDSPEGGQVFVESLPKTYPVGLMDDATVDVVRDEMAKTTTYLVAIPWAKIAPVSPADPAFSLTVTVNKNDGVPRDNYRSLGLAGWQTWGDGLNNWKLSKYQQVQLTK